MTNRRRNLLAFLLLLCVAVVVRAALWPLTVSALERTPTSWCVVCGERWLADALSNVVLFIPVGLTARLLGATPMRALLYGMLSSFAIECLQWYGAVANRTPAAIDLLTNAAGSYAGATLPRLAEAARTAGGRAFGAVALGWSASASALFLGTAWAIVPDENLAPRGPLALSASRYTYSPGYGYYGGSLSGISLNTQRVMADRVGPVVRQATSLPDVLSARIALAYPDASPGVRAMVYLHGVSDSTAVLRIAQHGGVVQLFRRLRSDRLGLAPIVVETPTNSVETLRHARIDAEWSRGGASISVTDGAIHRGATVSFTPIVGWALVQSVVGVTSALAPAVQLGWLCLLLSPLGWTVARAMRGGIGAGTRGWRATSAVSVLLPLAVLLGAPVVLGVRPLRPQDWTQVTAAVLLGVLVAPWPRRPTAPPPAPPLATGVIFCL